MMAVSKVCRRSFGIFNFTGPAFEDAGRRARPVLLEPACQVADQLLGFLRVVEFPSLAQHPVRRGVQLLRQTIGDVAGLVDLASLDRDIASEGYPNRLRQRLRAIHDEQPCNGRVETALDEIVEERLHGGGVLGGSVENRQRMLAAVTVNADGGDEHQIVADMQAVDLNDEQVELRQVGIHESGQPVRRRTAGARRGDGSGSTAARLRWTARAFAASMAGSSPAELGAGNGGGLARAVGDEPDADQRLDAAVRARRAASGRRHSGQAWQRCVEIGGIAPVRRLAARPASRSWRGPQAASTSATIIWRPAPPFRPQGKAAQSSAGRPRTLPRQLP